MPLGHQGGVILKLQGNKVTPGNSPVPQLWGPSEGHLDVPELSPTGLCDMGLQYNLSDDQIQPQMSDG